MAPLRARDAIGMTVYCQLIDDQSEGCFGFDRYKRNGGYRSVVKKWIKLLCHIFKYVLINRFLMI